MSGCCLALLNGAWDTCVGRCSWVGCGVWGIGASGALLVLSLCGRVMSVTIQVELDLCGKSEMFL